MKWYNYLAALAGGFFTANIIPHLVKGMTGQEFPSPFGVPSGVGLSTPIENVIWAMINLTLSYVLLRVSKVKFDNTISMVLVFLGVALCAFMCASNFGSNPNL